MRDELEHLDACCLMELKGYSPDNWYAMPWQSAKAVVVITGRPGPASIGCVVACFGSKKERACREGRGMFKDEEEV